MILDVFIVLFVNVAWSPDGTHVAAATARGAKVWDVETGHSMLHLPEDIVYSVAWSPDGRRLATTSRDTTVRVWDTSADREVFLLSGHRWDVQAVAWSPDGRRLATAGRDHVIKIWDAVTGTELATLYGHRDEVFSVAWRPDGQRLATASADRTVRIWDPRTGLELFSLPLHTQGVTSVSWDPDGKRLAAASSVVQVYTMDIDQLSVLARSRVTRNLTPRESLSYLHVEQVPPIPFS